MERDTLSFSQWMALLLGALLGPAIELLPGSAAQAGIAGAASAAVGIALFGAAGFIAGYLVSDGGLLRAIGKSFGTWGGKAVLFLYLIWGELLLALRLRLAAQRMLESGERDGAAWFFILVLGALAWWMGKGSLGALGRAAQLFFLALAVAGGPGGWERAGVGRGGGGRGCFSWRWRWGGAPYWRYPCLRWIRGIF